MEPYLVFPELINMKKPPEEEEAIRRRGLHVTVPTETCLPRWWCCWVTRTPSRHQPMAQQPRYHQADGLVCGFRQEAERDGELDFVLCFCPTVGQPVRTLFQGLFKNSLPGADLTVKRYEPVRCSKGHQLNRAVVREALQHGKRMLSARNAARNSRCRG